MDTLHDPDDNPPDPQAATPYFRRLKFHRITEAEAAVRGLPPEPWAA